VVLTACGITSEQKTNLATPQVEVNQVDPLMLEAIHHNETIGNLSYEIQLAKNQFLDDEIEVSAKVTNLGNETLTFVQGSSSCPDPFFIDMVHQESSTRLAIKQGENCTADISSSKLFPGERSPCPAMN
jgi:hypothetical protein